MAAEQTETAARLDRRALVRGTAVAGVALPLLVACGSDGETASTDPTGDASTGDPSAQPSETGTGGGDGGEGGGEGLVAAADVPVGGGVVLQDAQIVVTQPSEGEFRGFTAVCTHQGCIVGSVEEGRIVCPCHGSMYDITDGTVVGGPAPDPLSPVEVSVQDGQVVEG